MKSLIWACIGFLLAYYGVGLLPAFVVFVLIGSIVYVAFPSQKQKQRKEDYEWAKADPMGHWEAHRKK